MENLKLFQILNEIIFFYSGLTITTASVDSFLTLQIISSYQADLRDLNLTKAELAVLGKLTSSKYQYDCKCVNASDLSHKSNEPNTQQSSKPSIQEKGQNNHNTSTSLAQCTLVAIHEYGENYTRLQKRKLTKTLMKKVENILIVEEDLSIRNNLLHFQPDASLGRPMVIIGIQESKGSSSGNRDKRFDRLIEEMQKYLQICDIFYGHINLRVCLYEDQKQSGVKLTSAKEEIACLIRTSVQYEQSEDDLDILLRPQIPQHAFIKILSQCGNRVSRQHIKANPQSYALINDKQKYYSFRTVPNGQSSIPPILPADQFIIWVLEDGRPLLKLLPPLHPSKKKSFTNLRKAKAGGKNDRFEERRSLLGCTLFLMEDRICKGKEGNSKSSEPDRKGDEDDDDNDSLECANSEYGQGNEGEEGAERAENQEMTTYIINVEKGVGEGQRQKLVEEEMCRVLDMLMKERKELYQNMEINRKMQMISRIAAILQAQEKDVCQVVFLDKL